MVEQRQVCRVIVWLAANQLWICGTCCQTPHYEKLSPWTTLAGWNLNLDHGGHKSQAAQRQTGQV